jgi:hypothetical protein
MVQMWFSPLSIWACRHFGYVLCNRLKLGYNGYYNRFIFLRNKKSLVIICAIIFYPFLMQQLRNKKTSLTELFLQFPKNKWYMVQMWFSPLSIWACGHFRYVPCTTNYFLILPLVFSCATKKELQ